MKIIKSPLLKVFKTNKLFRIKNCTPKQQQYHYSYLKLFVIFINKKYDTSILSKKLIFLFFISIKKRLGRRLFDKPPDLLLSKIEEKSITAFLYLF